MQTEIKIEKEIVPGETVPGVQICPFGEWPGEKSAQVCDSKAFTQLIADWDAAGAKEILMDFEHQSEVEKIDSDTRAAAWISNLAIDDALGLVGDFKFTDKGAEAVNSRSLRFLSPTWYTDADGRPTKLTSVALTNKPNIPVKPILNKEKAKAEGEGEQWPVNSSVQPPTSDLRPSQTNQQPEKENKTMNEIKVLLGLPPEASDDDVLNAIKACVAKNKECERAALEKEADEFAEANAKKCNKEVLKAQYIANKDVAKALVAGIPDAPASEAPQKILNKGTSPDVTEDMKLQRNKAVAEYRSAHGCDFGTAWAACRANNPELFND